MATPRLGELDDPRLPGSNDAWLASADTSYAFRGESVPRDGWQFFIDALDAAARYE